MSARDLISVGDLKALIGAEGTADDGPYALYTAAASDYVRNTRERDFWFGEREERLSGRGRRRLYPREYPITEVLELFDGSTELEPYDYDAETGDFVIDESRECIVLVDPCARFSSTPGAVRVKYKAGYESIPFDLVTACCLIALYWFRRRSTLGTSHESATGASVLIDRSDVPAEAVRILEDNYPHRYTI